MNSIKDICPLCGGHKKQGTTTVTVDMGNTLVVVRNVPATICSLCANAWLSDEVAGDIEIIVEEAKKNHRQMEVTQYRKAA
ncbi:type II toxin-antitoxin system MqsA family antitoxin [Desulfobacter postgatei]|jgi:YgiT-type zinc finger domain-containing protein|uniref:YgiT-type zinc finger domain protein n=1 Tax=Desulfobacter postgatei 2ac9 TaxID=879212 RepID=I5B418_9BACT|nr:type II toxin-antitoxin system MqsA family antitoxin [Desulfobacter postgatei]EIM64231.1 YgiT-type zinc finger domain protein [Desulfobacter postgatei 2ac9]